MLFSILNIFFDLSIIILLLRYFIERYQFYGYGPILHAVFEITNRLLQPLQNAIPNAGQRLRENMTLMAIGVVILIRALFLCILPAIHPLAGIIPAQGLMVIPTALGLSVTMGITLICEVLIAFLFASMMIARRGLMATTDAGFACFKERTFEVFKMAQRLVNTQDLRTLFLVSSAVILIIGSLLTGITSLAFLRGFAAYEVAVLVSFFEILQSLIGIYTILLVLTILSGWVGADQFSTIVQVLRSMTDPYLNIFRRWFPWARIDFIDLSPIFAFIALMLMSGLLTSIQGSLLAIIHSQATSAPSSPPTNEQPGQYL